MAKGPYSRVYHELMDEFPTVFRSDAQLGCFLRCLILAEKFYPSQAPMPRRNPQLQSLIRVGLVLVNEERGTFTIRGLMAERERRSEPGRIAAAVRWQSGRNTNAMPDETRRERDEKGANASSNGTFMGWKPKPGLHDGSHGPSCSVCAPLLGTKR
jgi:hypothetical protein